MFDTKPAAQHLSPKDWVAEMIAPCADQGGGGQASFVSTRIVLDSVPDEAVLHISAQGLYRAFLNGQRVGEDILTPGWTAYDLRLNYQSYDVAALLKPGENRLDIWLGDGWFRSQLMWEGSEIENAYGPDIAAIAQIMSGDRVILATGAHWMSGRLPILKSGIYFGETYDARVSQDIAIRPVRVLDGFDTSILVPSEATPVRELAPHPFRDKFMDSAGRYIFDFGQNCAGYVRITVQGEAGARIIVEHSEILDPVGGFENSNMRAAAARLDYTLKGGEAESYAPHFTYQGFRYARVTIEGQAAVLDIVQVPITSCGPETAWLTTGNPLVNQLVQNTKWSQRSNFVDVPTDCPQRDERLGWTGDAQIFAATACTLFDSHDFFVKWLRDVMAEQLDNGAIRHYSPDPLRLHHDRFPTSAGSMGWGDAICIVPWELYKHYGDREILIAALPAMIRWLDFVWSISDGPIVRPPMDMFAVGHCIGDHLQPTLPEGRGISRIGKSAIATLYHYISTDLTARIAKVLGETDLSARLEERATRIRHAYQSEFITDSGRIGHDDQTSYALAFLFDLIPAEKRQAARRYFAEAVMRSDWRLQTGFLGTPALLPALVKAGLPEIAQELLLQEEAPGWLYQVRLGATSIWERWDSLGPDGTPFEPSMNSFNHYSYGAVCQFLFEQLAGIQPDAEAPGYRNIRIAPCILPKLSPVSAAVETPHGRVSVDWSVTGNRVSYQVDIPQGASAILQLSPDFANPRLDGYPLTSETDPTADRSLSAGRYMLEFDLPAHLMQFDRHRCETAPLRS